MVKDEEQELLIHQNTLILQHLGFWYITSTYNDEHKRNDYVCVRVIDRDKDTGAVIFHIDSCTSPDVVMIEYRCDRLNSE